MGRLSEPHFFVSYYLLILSLMDSFTFSLYLSPSPHSLSISPPPSLSTSISLSLFLSPSLWLSFLLGVTTLITDSHWVRRFPLWTGDSNDCYHLRCIGLEVPTSCVYRQMTVWVCAHVMVAWILQMMSWVLDVDCATLSGNLDELVFSFFSMLRFVVKMIVSLCP